MRLDIHSSLLKLNVCLVVENAWILPEFNFSFLISTGEHKPVMIFFPMLKLLDPKFPAAHTDTFSWTLCEQFNHFFQQKN